VFSLLVLPLAGFTERTRYVPNDIFRDYEITGLGTYGYDFNLFEYPAAVDTVSILALLMAVVLLYPLNRSLREYRAGPNGTGDSPRTAARVSAVIAAGLVVLILFAMYALFPGAEERTIWITTSEGWLVDWWPGYGAFIGLAGIGGMAGALTVAARRLPVAAPETPPPPPPPPAA
jgi:hypothetical protein